MQPIQVDVDQHAVEVGEGIGHHAILALYYIRPIVFIQVFQSVHVCLLVWWVLLDLAIEEGVRGVLHCWDERCDEIPGDLTQLDSIVLFDVDFLKVILEKLVIVNLFH